MCWSNIDQTQPADHRYLRLVAGQVLTRDLVDESIEKPLKALLDEQVRSLNVCRARTEFLPISLHLSP